VGRPTKRTAKNLSRSRAPERSSFLWNELTVAVAMNGKIPTVAVSVKKEVGMALAIVWRNPNRLITTKRTLHRVQGDQFGVVYTVTDPNGTVEFSLKSGSKMAS
jgi:hypothetical protein